VIETQRRHLAHAELTTREQPAVTGDDIVLAINQDRDIEVENVMLLAICRICFLLWRADWLGPA
jgi:hypothetical protein